MVGMVLPLLSLKDDATMFAFDESVLVERKSGESMVGKNKKKREREGGIMGHGGGI